MLHRTCPLCNKGFLGSPKAIIMTYRPVPVCTPTMRPAYTICRRPAPCQQWRCWTPGRVSGYVICVPLPVENPPRLPEDLWARVSFCAMRFIPNGRRFSPEILSAWVLPTAWLPMSILHGWQKNTPAFLTGY